MPHHHSAEDLSSNPYRIFFFVGILSALVGVSYWPLFGLGATGHYPRTEHGTLMYFGFMYSYIMGFLFTAIPRMTQTKPLGRGELVFAVSLQIALLASTIGTAQIWSIGFAFSCYLFMVAFLLRRVRETEATPFPGLMFIPAALFMAAVGFVGHRLSAGNDSFLLSLAGEAFVMNLILGLGSRLIPYISGLVTQSPDSVSPSRNGLAHCIFVLCTLNSGYLLGNFGDTSVGAAMRSFATWWATVFLLKAFRRPQPGKTLALGLQISAFFLAFGQTMRLPMFGLGLAGAHLVYIGGFTLMTLLISTRVVLSHGNAGLEYENRSWGLGVMLGLTGASAVMRFLAASDLSSASMLGAAAALLLGLCIWLFKFIGIELARRRLGAR